MGLEIVHESMLCNGWSLGWKFAAKKATTFPLVKSRTGALKQNDSFTGVFGDDGDAFSNLLSMFSRAVVRQFHESAVSMDTGKIGVLSSPLYSVHLYTASSLISACMPVHKKNGDRKFAIIKTVNR